MRLWNRRQLARYPWLFFALLNLVCLLTSIFGCVGIICVSGFQEWQLYGFIAHRSATAIMFVSSFVITSLGTVSIPRYYQMWQISFTLLLLIPTVVSAVLVACSLQFQKDLDNQMQFVFGQVVARTIRMFVMKELGCTEFDSCDAEATKRAEPIRKQVTIISWIILTVNLANFAANCVFLLLFKVPDAETKFAETSIEEDQAEE